MLFDDLSDIQDVEETPAARSMPRVEPALEALKFDIRDDVPEGTRIKVIGVGGGGSNAVGRMFRHGIPGVEFHAINTDRQALYACPTPNRLLIGQRVTNGLGAGGDPAMGKEAAMESTSEILEILEGAQMVFVATGMGGGTGTGAAPMIASWAREMNALTVAIVTMPFAFEGPRRQRIAEKGLEELSLTVDALMLVPNERLKSLVGKGTPLLESFRAADEVLGHAVTGIAEIVHRPGLINRDFSDIRVMMQGMGRAMAGCGTAEGERAVIEAARKALHNPMIEEGELRGTRGMLIQITGSSRIALDDVDEACTLMREAAGNEEVNLNFGLSIDESMGDQVKVTVIATGFDQAREPEEAMVEEPRHEIFTMPAPAIHEPEPEAAPLPPMQSSRVSYFVPPPAAMPEPVADEEPMPVSYMQPMAAEPAEAVEDLEDEHAMAAVTGTNGSTHMEEPSKVVDDLDVPAFLRKERRWWS